MKFIIPFVCLFLLGCATTRKAPSQTYHEHKEHCFIEQQECSMKHEQCVMNFYDCMGAQWRK